MPNKLYPLFLVLLLTACASQDLRKKENQDKLFPDGVYRQKIQLEIYKKGKVTHAFPFASVSRLKEGSFEILGLSPFGTSIFEAKGGIEKPDEVEIKFFIKPPEFMKKSFIVQTMNQINNLYLLKESDLTKKSDRDIYQKGSLLMEIFKYNSQSIPSDIRLQAKGWRVYVQTQDYKTLD